MEGVVRTVKGSLARTRWAAIGAAVAVSLGGGTLLVANAATDANTFRPITPCRLLDTRPVQVDAAILPTGIKRGKTGVTAGNDFTVIFDPSAKYDPATDPDNYTYQVDGMSSQRSIMGACNDLIGGDINPVHEVKAVLLNVTTVNTSAVSFLTLYPWLEDVGGRPLASVMNPSTSPVAQFNSVTVALNSVSSASAVGLPGVTCSDNGPRGTSDCRGLTAFRVYNHLGTTDVIIDVMGYYF